MARSTGSAKPSMLRILVHRFLKALLWFAAGSALLVLIFRWVPPPGTALMVERKVESWFDGEPIDLQRNWRPWDEISNELKVAVIAGEDQKFAEHWGFDFSAIRAAFAHNEQGGTLRGASTLSQQVSKNLFLWSGRSWLRKGLEAWFTGLIEVLWLELSSIFAFSAASRRRCRAILSLVRSMPVWPLNFSTSQSTTR